MLVVDSKETMKKLENLGVDMIGEIKTNQSPTFTTKVRSKGNIIFDEGLSYIRLGDKKEKRTFVNVGQAKKFMQTVAVANKCKKFLNENSHTSIRGLFYQLKFSLGEDLEEELFSEQEESNPLIEDLEVALGIKREDLNLNTDRKGVVAGGLVLKDKFGGREDTIDCSKQGRSGWMIPSDVDNGMEFKKVDADYVLVVEKDALWQRLNEDKFWQKENCILITPKGQASRGCRRLIRKLADQKLPVYCFSIDAHEPIVFMDEDGLIHNERICDYVDETMAKNGSLELGGYERSIAEGKALEVDRKCNAITGKMLSVVRHRTEKNLFEIVCEAGFSIRSTGSHSVMVFDKETYEIVPKEVSELKLGDLLASPLKVPNNESVTGINITEMVERECPELKTKIIGLPNGRIRWGKSELRFPNEIEVSPEFARLLGYYAAEGNLGDKVTLTFGSHETAYIEDAARCIKKVFGYAPAIVHPHPSSVQMSFGGRLVEAVFERLLKCGKGAENKRIPSVVFNINNNLKMEFLMGYFRGDGSVKITKKGCRLWASTVSRHLASDLVLMMLQLGCWATISKKKRGKEGWLDAYHILIQNRESLARLKNIATDLNPAIAESIEKKIVKSPVSKSIPVSLLKPVQKTIYSLGGKGISDIFSQKRISHSRLRGILSKLDASPLVKRDRILLALSKTDGAHTSELAAQTGEKFITVFKTLERAEKKELVKSEIQKGDRFWRITGEVLPNTALEKLEVLKNIARDEIALLPVTKIMLVKPSTGYVYDVEVNPTHTFVGGVGPLLLHNTDCDAWGWYIYWAIKTGSMNLAFLGSDIATPEARFIGVTMRDIQDYDFLKKLTIKAKEVDIKRAEEMLAYPWISRHPEWVEELKVVLETKKKLEQDALQGPRLSFVGEYLRDKIEGKKFLP